MSRIVTLDEMKVHLRYELDPSNDSDVEPILLAAESAVIDYISDEFDDFDYPESICMAVKLYAGYFDQFRGSDKEAPVNGNYMPQPCQALLYKYRQPTVG